MRLAYTVLLLKAALGASAAPAATAASYQEVATVGYATLGGGTTGGKGGKVVKVSSLSALEAAARGDAPTIIVVTGAITGNQKIKLGSNKSIIGADKNARLEGIGLLAKRVKNIIIRNLSISKVQAKAGDAIALDQTSHVWIDHVDLFSDLTHGKDYYDGLIDLTHGTDYVTISNSKFHDHMKASLIGHSDKNEQEDTGHLRVTFFNNYWYNINSRTPSLRFGTAHIYDSVFINVNTGINVRKGAQALVENVSFKNSTKPLWSADETGAAVHRQNDLGQKQVTVKAGKLAAPPYKYKMDPIADVKEGITKRAGQTLSFG